MDKTVVDEYIKQHTWRVKENANTTFCYSGLMAHLGEYAIKEYMLKEIYTPKIANAHKSGHIHIHDLGYGLIGYCAGWSLKQLLEEGYNGVQDKVQSGAPKHFRTALGQMVNFLGTLQLEFAGAQAFSSFDTYLAPYVAKDKLTYKEVKQGVQEFVFNMNVPSRWSSQAPFTNITLDWVCPEDLKNVHPKIGGHEIEETYGDFQKEMDMVNKAFLEVMIEGDNKERVFSFPIPTYNITKDFIWDNDNAKLLFEMTAKYGIPYFQNFINSTLQPSDVRSMCPMSYDTKVFVDTEKGKKIIKIGELYTNQNKHKSKYKTFFNGEWYDSIVTEQGKQNIYEIELYNGEILKFGENHLQNIYGKGTIKTKNIKKGQYVPYNTTSYDTNIGTYDLGYIIGLYAGDGSSDKYSITFSLNKDTDIDASKKIIKFFNRLGFTTNKRIDNKLMSIIVNGKESVDFIKRYINGTALDKEFNQRIFDLSKKCRQGILDGWYQADGGNKNRIYTFSKKLKEQFFTICASLGYLPKLDYIDTRDGRYSNNKCYVIKYITGNKYSDLFFTENGIKYIKIVNIKNTKKKQKVFCFNVDNEEAQFVLANGLITHNCRLQMDIRELRNNGNGLFGAGEQTGSIGVVTINLPKLGYEANQKEDKEKEFFKLLDKYMEIGKESLEVKRKLVIENMDNGLMPFTKRYLGTWKNHFSTIGLIGMNELCLNYLGEDITSKEGYAFAKTVLNHMRERLADFQEETGNYYNLEATPAEGTTYRLARIDKEQYPDIITQGCDDSVYYTNSSHLPVDHTSDIIKAIQHQDSIQTLYTGGTVMHIYLGERVTDWINCMMLVKKIANNTRMPYFSITPTFSVCPIHGYISGEHEYCPLDHSKTDLDKYGMVYENKNNSEVEEND